ncbi:MAG: DNA topoisomerase-1, partial [Myxococcota bacterium]
MKMLVVESAAKARTIQKYLRDEWAVLATGGHVQDLPSGPEHGKAGRKATFAEGRDGLPNPPWVWTDRGEQAMRKIFDRADKEGISEFFLATDPDREGEFIAWRLQALLEDRGATHRVTFHEVTADAIADAIGRPRRVDMHLVESASVRKFLDRFVGFRTSKLARAYLSGGGKASMGRVQTPTLGFIVERELEREAHIPIPFFEVRALTAGDEGVEFSARFHEPKDPDAWRDDADKVHPTRTSHTALATETHGGLVSAGVLTITQAKRGASSRKPRTAFSTDQLLQAAGNRWGWSPGRTMRTATELYEGGHITYIRTDSNRMSATFVESARALIEKDWGKDYLGAGAAAVKPTGKVQDAHEAIRPTRADVVKP